MDICNRKLFLDTLRNVATTYFPKIPIPFSTFSTLSGLHFNTLNTNMHRIFWKTHSNLILKGCSNEFIIESEQLFAQCLLSITSSLHRPKGGPCENNLLTTDDEESMNYARTLLTANMNEDRFYIIKNSCYKTHLLSF